MKYQTEEDKCKNALEEVKKAVACDVFNKVYKDGQINMGFHGVVKSINAAIRQYAESHTEYYGKIPERIRKIKKQLAYALETLDCGYTGSIESVYEELASEALYDSGFSFDIIDSKGAFFVRESLLRTDPARLHAHVQDLALVIVSGIICLGQRFTVFRKTQQVPHHGSQGNPLPEAGALLVP